MRLAGAIELKDLEFFESGIKIFNVGMEFHLSMKTIVCCFSLNNYIGSDIALLFDVYLECHFCWTFNLLLFFFYLAEQIFGAVHIYLTNFLRIIKA